MGTHVELVKAMGLYNFKARFVDQILAGHKTHTIRGTRKRTDRPGNTMHLYTGLRQKNARLLMRVPCVRVDAITISVHHEVTLGEELLSSDECDALARRDGFATFAEMMEFWEGRLPFEGHVYHWDPAKRFR